MDQTDLQPGLHELYDLFLSRDQYPGNSVVGLYFTVRLHMLCHGESKKLYITREKEGERERSSRVEGQRDRGQPIQHDRAIVIEQW